MSDFYGCTCMQYGPFEHLSLWRKRAAPTLARLVSRHKRIDLARMMETTRLVTVTEKGLPEVFSPEKMAHSHHLPGCPFKKRAWVQRTVAASDA